MTRLNWTSENPRYETGIDMGVYYPPEGPGVAWNGLVGVSESSSDSEGPSRYIDGRRLRSRQLFGSFAGTIQAFTYPEGLESSALLSARARPFGMTYRVMNQSGYKIHLVYNIRISPTQMDRRFLTTDPFSWEFSTRPQFVPNGYPTAHLVFDAETAYSEAFEALDALLYGSDAGPAQMPSPREVHDIVRTNSELIVTDHGDGTFTVTGPDKAIEMIDETTFEITHDQVEIDDGDPSSYTIRSL